MHTEHVDIWITRKSKPVARDNRLDRNAQVNIGKSTVSNKLNVELFAEGTCRHIFSLSCPPTDEDSESERLGVRLRVMAARL